jgi:hypothetical protein
MYRAPGGTANTPTVLASAKVTAAPRIREWNFGTRSDPPTATVQSSTPSILHPKRVTHSSRTAHMVYLPATPPRRKWR